MEAQPIIDIPSVYCISRDGSIVDVGTPPEGYAREFWSRIAQINSRIYDMSLADAKAYVTQIDKLSEFVIYYEQVVHEVSELISDSFGSSYNIIQAKVANLVSRGWAYYVILKSKKIDALCLSSSPAFSDTRFMTIINSIIYSTDLR